MSIEIGLFSNIFFGKKTQRNLPRKWLVTWLYGIILFIFSTIFIKIIIWEKIKEIFWMVDLEYFSSFNIWPGERYHTISCKCFLDVICTFKFSTKKSILLFLKVKFWFTKLFQFRDVLGIFCSLLLLRRTFSHNFLFVDRTIFLFEWPTDEPIQWHASMSFVKTLTPISSNILILIFLQHFGQEDCPEIHRFQYCSSIHIALMSYDHFLAILPNFLNHYFSSWIVDFQLGDFWWLYVLNSALLYLNHWILWLISFQNLKLG